MVVGLDRHVLGIHRFQSGELGLQRRDCRHLKSAACLLGGTGLRDDIGFWALQVERYCISTQEVAEVACRDTNIATIRSRSVDEKASRDCLGEFCCGVMTKPGGLVSADKVEGEFDGRRRGPWVGLCPFLDKADQGC